MNNNNEIVYFELNNWCPGEDYPAEEPFTTWIGDDLNIFFDNEEWVKENRLCVVWSIVDMSVNFCITTTKKWVEENCPKLLCDHKKFLRNSSENDKHVYGQFGNQFLEYKAENFGITRVYD